jgi:hypothetical protein
VGRPARPAEAGDRGPDRPHQVRAHCDRRAELATGRDYRHGGGPGVRQGPALRSPAGHHQAREAAVSPLVKKISPALLWHFDEAGWNVIGYDYVPGRHADYSPGSPDLDGLVSLMDALSAINVPDGCGPFKRAEDRWKPYGDGPASASLFAGSALTHSDWTPDNVLVSPDRAWLIDWAWPTPGAAWTDPACWVLRLMASGGHTVSEAERQASRLPAFRSADPMHIDLFAAANVQLWDEIAQQSTSAWTVNMAQASRSWAAHRQPR